MLDWKHNKIFNIKHNKISNNKQKHNKISNNKHKRKQSKILNTIQLQHQ